LEDQFAVPAARAGQGKSQLSLVWRAEEVNERVPFRQVRMSYRQGLIETLMHVLGYDHRLSRSLRKKDDKLRPRRLCRSGPIREASVTMRRPVGFGKGVARLCSTVRGDQLQRVASPVAIERLAQRRLAPASQPMVT
jgi:hypothetical protein